MRGAGRCPGVAPAAENPSTRPTRGGSGFLASLVVFLVVAVPATVGGGNAAETLSGVARVIDADTIEVAGERVRLMGIDAPERNQHCLDGTGRSYRCGAEAAAALSRRIDGVDMRCEATGRDRHGRAIATCFAADGVDVNGWLVREGHALAYRRYSQAYVGDEEAARCARRGVWEGVFVPPWRWRAGERLPVWDSRTESDDGGGSVTDPPAAPDGPPSGAASALDSWDDDGNGRITCREARRHGIAPVRRDHPAYEFMRDDDGDGVVCE